MDTQELLTRMKELTTLPAVLDLPEDVKPVTHGWFNVLDPVAGDVKIIWDRTKKPEVEEAERTFKNLKKKGYLAYKVEGKDGEKGEVLHDFDPNAERIILSPAMQGG